MKNRLRTPFLSLLLALVFVAAMAGCSTQSVNLSSWTPDSTAVNQLEEYVKAVTDESSEDFIPEEDRIAVFDFDGTLFGEKDPIYYEWQIFAYRVLEDSAYKDRATAEQIAAANAIIEASKAGIIPAGFEGIPVAMEAQVFAGMTVEEYQAYVRNYMDNTESWGFTNMMMSEEFYQPMMELVTYLQESGFTTYIVSGSDRFGVREVACDALNIPTQQVIGSDFALKADDNDELSSISYQLKDGEELVRTDVVLTQNLAINKATAIMKELGKQPVLCFGNSSGDTSMAVLTTSDNPYRSMAFMVLCDDVEREYGNLEKAAAQKVEWQERGWITISMANDWTTIYGEGVVKKQ